MTLDSALRAAQDFDPWDTVVDDYEGEFLAPDMYRPPTAPPEDSAFAPLPSSDAPPPWFRDVNGGESTADHNLFRHFIALGPNRTYKALADELDISYSKVTRLGSKFNWPQRAAAYDTYRDEQYERELAESVKEMAGRHAQIFSKALSGLSAAFEPLSDPERIAAELNELPVKERLRLATQAAKAMPALATAERLSLGMPTEIVDKKEEHTVRHEMSLDDLKGILSGLAEADFHEKVSSREPVIEAEVIEDEEDPGSAA